MQLRVRLVVDPTRGALVLEIVERSQEEVTLRLEALALFTLRRGHVSS